MENKHIEYLKIGLKLLLVNIVAGFFSFIAKTVIVRLGLASGSSTITFFAFLVALVVGLYIGGMTANKIFGWN